MHYFILKALREWNIQAIIQNSVSNAYHRGQPISNVWIFPIGHVPDTLVLYKRYTDKLLTEKKNHRNRRILILISYLILILELKTGFSDSIKRGHVWEKMYQ